MAYVLTNAEMREADGYTIRTLGVPSLELMERAGEALAAETERLLAKFGESEVLCVCGGGNNGGDGFVCARRLLERGIAASALCTAEKFSADCAINKEKFERAGGAVYSVFPRKRWRVVVDCLFGTGFSGALSGVAAETAAFINRMGAYVLAADIPSGVSGDSGLASPNAVKADETLCIGEYKSGVFLGDGADYSGERLRADIGISLPRGEEYAVLLDDRSAAGFLPERKKNSHKGSYGKTAIVGGGLKYAGAPLLSASAALRSGAGYTCLFVPKDALPYYLLRLPEALLDGINDGGKISFDPETYERLLGFDSVAFGMGAETSEGAYEVVKFLLREYTGRLILDADGINSLAKYGRNETESLFAGRKCDVILTPHPKEFSRLTGDSVSEIEKKGIAAPRAFAERYGVTVLLKGCASVVTDGNRTAINAAGTPGQAKGGSGDVLSGVIAGLCALGLSAFEGGAAGAYLTGTAAELAVRKTGEYSLLPSDVVKALPAAFLKITGSRTRG